MPILTKTTNQPWWVAASLIATTVLALANIVPRHQAEQSNRAVGIVVETDTVAELAATQELSLGEGLSKLNSALGGGDQPLLILSSNEATVGDLVASGSIEVRRLGSGTVECLGDPVQIGRVVAAWRARYGPDWQEDNWFARPDLLRTLPVGLPQRDIDAAQAGGYRLLARINTPAGASVDYIDSVFGNLEKTGVVDYYLPLGDVTLGAPDKVKEVSEILERHHVRYVAAEFVKTVGDGPLTAKAPGNTIRLHAAQTAELVRMPKSAIVERYVKAARERNIRLLLVRSPETTSERGLDDFANLLRDIRRGLEHEGLQVKPPRPFREPATSPILQALLGLAMIPALAYALIRVLATAFKVPSAVPWTLAAAIGLAVNLSATREYATLAGAILFPILAYFWFFEGRRPAWMSYLGMSAISLAGGLPIAGLLVGVPYMLHLDVFTGVKVAVFLPIFVVAWLTLQKLTDWREAMRQPIVWGTLFTSIFILGVLGFMYLRTGNDNPAAVSGLELKFRDLLDRWLVVRPRTKEFLIGHPALLIGILLWHRNPDAKWKAVAGFLLVVGAIGQTSIVNTMCHLHTPILLSLIRVMVGLGLGCIIGALGWLVVARIVPRPAGDDQ